MQLAHAIEAMDREPNVYVFIQVCVALCCLALQRNCMQL